MASRAGNPPPQRAAQNQQTLKTLVKVESNKSCADCKRNKHPRWASWNLGVFVCIRCSGIHRSMGTHISRVKSVDLDAWTDEQLANMLKWGNARANKYWEAKLTAGHVPSDEKIQNFIRTKYESKRWVMDGPMPDPSTLDVEGDDEVPLNVVQEKAKLERSASLRAAANAQQVQPPPQNRPKPPEIDLFGDDPPPPPRPSSAAPSPLAQPPPPKGAPAAPRQTKPGDSLLGFDFFAGNQSEPNSRPSSVSPPSTASNVPSRPDLKQSILSLYSSSAKTSAAQGHSRGQSSTSGFQSPPPQQPQSSSKDLSDAFGGLNFSSTSSQPSITSPKQSAFSNLTSPTIPKATPPSATVTSPGFGSGGGFFDAKPTPQPSVPTQANRNRNNSSLSGFGDFSSASPPPPSKPQPQSQPSKPLQTPAGNGLNDLLDFGGPSEPVKPAQPPPMTSPLAPSTTSPFNLSAPKPQPPTNPTPAQAPVQSPNMMINDPWGSNDAWAASASKTPTVSASKPPPPPMKSPAVTTSASGGWDMEPSWGASTTTATSTSMQSPGGDDFGGWESNAKTPTSATKPSKPVSSFNDADLFSNVWE